MVHNFEIEKACEDIGVNEVLKKMYLTDFNEICLKMLIQSQRTSYKYHMRLLKIMKKEISWLRSIINFHCH